MNGEQEGILESGYETEMGDFEEFGLGEEEWGSLGESGELGEGLYEEDLGELDEIGDLEGDEFLGSLWKKVKSVARRVAPILKKVAPMAGRVIGGALGGPAGALLGGKIGTLAGQLEAEGDFYDGELETETEDEMEANVVPGLTVANDAAAEELAAEAAETESEAEAQTLAGGTTIYIMGPAPLAIKRVAPVIARGTARLTRVLRKSPQTRPLIKVLPTITRKTVATLAKKTAKGKPVTSRTAVRTMAKQAVRVLSSPQKTAAALVKNSVKRRKFQRSAVARAERFL